MPRCSPKRTNSEAFPPKAPMFPETNHGFGTQIMIWAASKEMMDSWKERKSRPKQWKTQWQINCSEKWIFTLFCWFDAANTYKCDQKSRLQHFQPGVITAWRRLNKSHHLSCQKRCFETIWRSKNIDMGAAGKFSRNCLYSLNLKPRAQHQ